MSAAPPVLVLVNDLFFRAKIEATARLAGVPIRVVADAARLAPGEPAGGLFSGCLIDLESAGPAGLARLAEIARDHYTIGFLSHVQVDLAAQAKAAGCSEILPRSRMSAELPDLLRRLHGGTA